MVLPYTADANTPFIDNPHLISLRPSGNISVGDPVIVTGGSAQAYAITGGNTLLVWLRAGAGISEDANPVSDWYGVSRNIHGERIRVRRAGQVWVKANTGTAHLSQIGRLAYPSETGSAFGAVTGLSGQKATWSVANQIISGDGDIPSAMGQIVDVRGGASNPEWLVVFDFNSLGRGVKRY